MLRKLAPRALGTAAVLAVLPLAAHADTIATFDWIPVSNGGSGTGSGDLVLTLPGTLTGPGFDVPFATQAAAQNAVTGFSYSFSNGDTLSLTDLRGGSLALNPMDWETTATIQPAGAPPPPGIYLGTNFSFGGFATAPNGILTPYQVASSGGMVSLGAGDAQFRITDTGYWKLESLTAVPLPAAAWLLLSGLAGLVGTRRVSRLSTAS